MRTVDLSFVVPAHHCASTLERVTLALRDKARSFSAESFEILLVPNPYLTPQPDAAQAATQAVAESLAQKIPAVKVIRSASRPGKGAAMRHGVLNTQGAIVLTTDADLPYDLRFFDHAVDAIGQDRADFVWGDRRHPGTVFEMPGSLVELTAQRYVWSRRFNAFTTRLLRLGAVDTQTGIKAWRGEVARRLFQRISCMGFHYDLELFVMARRWQLRSLGLPVVFTQDYDHSTLKPGLEILRSFAWISRIAAQEFRGHYT